MSATPRKHERRLPDDRRRALIEAALRSLARDGQEGLSIRRIAAEAGVSVGLINHHFPSRVALVAEVYRLLHGRLAEAFEAAIRQAVPEARARLSAYFRASFSPRNLDADILHIWIIFWGLSRSTSEIRAVREETYAASLGVLERLIGEVMAGVRPHCSNASGKMGRRPRGLTPKLLAIGLTALLDGLWLEWCLNPATFQPEEGIALCEAWVDGVIERATGRRGAT